MSDPTAASFTITAQNPTTSVTASSSAALFTITPQVGDPIPPPGGETNVAGAGAGMTLALTLALG